MRIGIIETGIPPYKIGGAEKQAWNLAKNLAVTDEVTIYTGRYGGATQSEETEGVRIRRIKKLPKPFGILSYLIGMLFAIGFDREKPEALICFRAWPNGAVGYLAGKLFRIPGCYSIRGGDWYFVHRKWWGIWLYRLLSSSPMPCVFQTEKIKREVVSVFPAMKSVIIPNGIDVGNEVYGQGEDVVFLGNLLERKGVENLVRAMKGIEGTGVSIIGDGPERAKLEQLAEGMNASFLGKVDPDTAQQLLQKNARIVVLPAIKGEGLPNVLMESMALGIPVIASEVAGVADLLGYGRFGVLIPPGDVSALRQAIIRLLEDDILRNELGAAGRQAITKYSWDTVVQQWKSLADQLIHTDIAVKNTNTHEPRL